MLPARVVAERVGWCAGLVRGMAAGLVAERWNASGVAALASGRDAAGRPLPRAAWMAVRRLGWPVVAPEGVRVNDRVARMAQEQAGRVLRSACWRTALADAVLATWPAHPAKRTAAEWAAVRGAVAGGEHVPSAVIRARTRQVQRFLAARGRLPGSLFELEGPPGASGVLLLSACDRQQATIERSGTDPRRALLRLQLPVRPDPREYRDWTWVAVPLTLPPTVPPGAVLHLPALQFKDGRLRADLAFTHPVPAARRDGHAVALGVDWGLNTLLSARRRPPARGRDDHRPRHRGAVPGGRGPGQAAPAPPSRGAPARQGQPLRAARRRRAAPAESAGRGPGRRAPVGQPPAGEPQRRPGLVGGPLGGGPGDRRPGDCRLRRGPQVDGGPGHGPHPEHPAVAGGAREGHRADAAPGGGARHRGGHRPAARHVEVLPALPGAAAALQGTRQAHGAGLEVGRLPRVRVAGRPGPGRLAADRRPRPRPPEQDDHRPRFSDHGHPGRRRRP